MGMLVAVGVGVALDRLGLEVCTALTLVAGQVYAFFRLAFRESYALTLASFVVYTIFRNFLYPVFIASLTSRLGFKYFGILLGIGFTLTGLAQPLFVPLSDFLQGDCHLDDGAPAIDCDHGYWASFHVFSFLLLVALLVVPWLDYRDRVGREARVRMILAEQRSPAPSRTTYGSDL